MKRTVGRALQLLGLVILPAGLLIGLSRGLVQLEVRLMFIGGAIFFLGWLMSRGD
jgi:hypothetical protein